MDIVLVHGYNVTSTKTYGLLPQRLKAAGHNIKNVFLSKYVTLDDDIRMSDIVQGLQAALLDVYDGKLDKPFACITHSTGGLLARLWISTFYGNSMTSLPMTHLIMLAPPTNGSRLAELGKSRLSRIRSLAGIEPGLKILDALELGSEFQWSLNSEWMQKKLHQSAGFYPFVIAGQWVDKKLWDSIVPATYERGSDGVVRASAANMNMQKLTIRPDGKVTRDEIRGVAYLIAPKASHSDTRCGIMGSIPSRGSHPVSDAILKALDVETREDYEEVVRLFSEKTAALQRKEPYYDGSKQFRHSQVIFRVTDNLGNKLDDYALEIIDSSGRGDKLPSGFFGDKHKNGASAEFFAYYLNFDKMTEIKGGKVGFRVTTAPNTPLIEYKMAEMLAPVEGDVLRPNETTLVDVILKRRINRRLFELTKDFSYQKIDGEAGPDWIE